MVDVQEEAPNPVSTEWVYIGQRVSTKQKRIYGYAEVSDLNNVRYRQKVLITAAIGAVIKVWFSEDSYYISGTLGPTYIRRYENANQVGKWVAEEEAARQTLKQKSFNTKASKVVPLDPILSQLSQIALGLNSSERRALASIVLQHIY
jgi:hypothetical protein